MLNYNGAGDHIHIRKHKGLANYTCNLTNKERVANWFYMFQQKKTDVHPYIRSKRANSHL